MVHLLHALVCHSSLECDLFWISPCFLFFSFLIWFCACSRQPDAKVRGDNARSRTGTCQHLTLFDCTPILFYTSFYSVLFGERWIDSCNETTATDFLSLSLRSTIPELIAILLDDPWTPFVKGRPSDDPRLILRGPYPFELKFIKSNERCLLKSSLSIGRTSKHFRLLSR